MAASDGLCVDSSELPVALLSLLERLELDSPTSGLLSLPSDSSARPDSRGLRPARRRDKELPKVPTLSESESLLRDEARSTLGSLELSLLVSEWPPSSLCRRRWARRSLRSAAASLPESSEWLDVTADDLEL